jgi:hypothetical protein
VRLPLAVEPTDEGSTAPPILTICLLKMYLNVIIFFPSQLNFRFLSETFLGMVNI